MAKFSYTLNQDSEGYYIEYTVSELSYVWGSGANESNFTGNGYWSVGISYYPFVSGQTSAFGNGDIMDDVLDGCKKIYPNTSDTSGYGGVYQASSWVRLASPGYIYPFAAISNSTGEYMMTMYGVTTTSSVSTGITHPGVYIDFTLPRPDYFYWENYETSTPDYSKLYYLPSAVAWNAMRQNVIDLLIWKGIVNTETEFMANANIAIPAEAQGFLITAEYFNRVINALGQLHNTNLSSLKVTQYVTPLYWSHFRNIQTYLNSVG